MGALEVTLIDVGWGDSIFINYEGDDGSNEYALVDSNDTKEYLASYMFLKKFFERKDVDKSPLFNFVMLSHAHTDHCKGLKRIIKEFRSEKFWYPKSEAKFNGLIDIINYLNQHKYIKHDEAVNSGKKLKKFGDVEMKVLWPPYDHVPDPDHNNNSIVLQLTLGNVSFILTGDAEKEVWREVADDLPDNIGFFKVPHHGSENGSIDRGDPAWLDSCPANVKLGISCHVWRAQRYHHPHTEVTELFENRGVEYYRTDEQYHITFRTDGNNVSVKYSGWSG